MCCSVLTAQYFYRRRGLANGLIFAGGGIGGAVISLSMSAVVERFGTAWTFRLLGLLMLATGLPLTFFLKERIPVRSAAFIDWCVPLPVHITMRLRDTGHYFGTGSS